MTFQQPKSGSKTANDLHGKLPNKPLPGLRFLQKYSARLGTFLSA